jgi:hypothetical protein
LSLFGDLGCERGLTFDAAAEGRRCHRPSFDSSLLQAAFCCAYQR